MKNPSEFAAALENRITYLLSECLNDCAPIGQELYRDPAKKVIKECLQSQVVRDMADACSEMRAAEMRAFGQLGKGISPHSSGVVAADKALEAYRAALKGEG
jgi:hypothetical protein